MLLLLMLLMRTRYSRVDNSNVFIPSLTTSLSLWFVSKMMSMANVPSISYLVFSRSRAMATVATPLEAFPVVGVGKHNPTNTYILVVV